MIEEWKLVRQIKRNSGLIVKYMVSNYGNVKLQAYVQDKFVAEEQLYLGYGLYISGTELSILNVGKTIYRLVYSLFKGNIPRGYQIHHLDYNHFNNDVNNLVCVSCKKHAQYHENTQKYFNGIIPNKDDVIYDDYLLWLKSVEIKNKIINYKYNSIDAKRDIFDKIYNMFEKKSIPIREQIKQEKLEKQKQKQQQKVEQLFKERELKIQSGKYILDDNGHLHLAHTSKWTQEIYDKILETRKHSEAWKNRNKKLQGLEPANKGKHLVYDNDEHTKWHFE